MKADPPNATAGSPAVTSSNPAIVGSINNASTPNTLTKSGNAASAAATTATTTTTNQLIAMDGPQGDINAQPEPTPLAQKPKRTGTEYEQQREDNIAKNRRMAKRMDEPGVLDKLLQMQQDLKKPIQECFDMLEEEEAKAAASGTKTKPKARPVKAKVVDSIKNAVPDAISR